jgi:uncharacterized protein (DUF2132 family)
MNMGRQRVAVHLPCVMQEELPKEFLTKLSHEYGLTSLEEVAFIETFSRETAIPVILKTLNISLSAYKTRMGNIYAKFSFRDGGRGKRNRLLYFLHDRYRKETPQGVHPSYAMSNNAYPRMMARAVNLGVLTAH